jgi:hypothetical protein
LKHPFVCLLLLSCALGSLTRALPSQHSAHASAPATSDDSVFAGSSRIPRATGCFATIAPSSMRRVSIFLEASLPDYPNGPLKPQADLMAQEVASEFRRLLGVAGNTVPDADTTFAWFSVPAELALVAYRNGDVIAQGERLSGDSAATLVLIRAFNAVHARGAARISFPRGFVDDSATVHLALWPGYFDDTTQAISPDAVVRRFALFTLMEPEWSPAAPLPNQSSPKYPREDNRSGTEGNVLMQMIVNKDGRAEPSSIRDVWPDGESRPAGNQGRAYDDFVESVTTWLTTLRFQPARLGQCPVSQNVQLPVAFRVP